MRCGLCKKNEATIHYTEVINNKVQKIHLCEACARERGIDVELPFSFSDIMSALTQELQSLHGGKPAATSDDRTCPSCGLSFTQFTKQGRLGCAHCYETFDNAVLKIVQSVQKATRHVGKVPTRSLAGQDVVQRIARLEQAQARAVSDERYEECATLRDDIRRLRASLQTPAADSPPAAQE